MPSNRLAGTQGTRQARDLTEKVSTADREYNEQAKEICAKLSGKIAHQEFFFRGLADLGFAGVGVFCRGLVSGFCSERPTEAVEFRAFINSSFVIEKPPRKRYHKNAVASSLYKLLILLQKLSATLSKQNGKATRPFCMSKPRIAERHCRRRSRRKFSSILDRSKAVCRVAKIGARAVRTMQRERRHPKRAVQTYSERARSFRARQPANAVADVAKWHTA